MDFKNILAVSLSFLALNAMAQEAPVKSAPLQLHKSADIADDAARSARRAADFTDDAARSVKKAASATDDAAQSAQQAADAAQKAAQSAQKAAETATNAVQSLTQQTKSATNEAVKAADAAQEAADATKKATDATQKATDAAQEATNTLKKIVQSMEEVIQTEEKKEKDFPTFNIEPPLVLEKTNDGVYIISKDDNTIIKNVFINRGKCETYIYEKLLPIKLLFVGEIKIECLSDTTDLILEVKIITNGGSFVYERQSENYFSLNAQRSEGAVKTKMKSFIEKGKDAFKKVLN